MKMLPKPLGYRETTALFGYRHLLLLLAIKTLQARFLPLKQIGEILGPLNEKALEDLVQRGAPANAASLVFPEGEKSGGSPDRSRTRKGRRSEVSSSSGTPGTLTAPPMLPGIGVAEGPVAWERLVIEPGLELQVRSNYLAPGAPSAMSALLSKIRVLLSTRQQRKTEIEAANERPGPSPRE
jgi:hypothetical protein